MKDFEIDSDNLSPALPFDDKSLEIRKETHDKNPSGCSIISTRNRSRSIQPLL